MRTGDRVGYVRLSCMLVLAAALHLGLGVWLLRADWAAVDIAFEQAPESIQAAFVPYRPAPAAPPEVPPPPPPAAAPEIVAAEQSLREVLTPPPAATALEPERPPVAVPAPEPPPQWDEEPQPEPEPEPAPVPRDSAPQPEVAPEAPVEAPSPLTEALEQAQNIPETQTGTQTLNTARELIRNPTPPYPMRARAEGREGTVVLQIVVNGKGRPVEANIHASSGHADLDERARAWVVKRWRFSQPDAEERQVETTVFCPVAFQLR